MVGLGGVIGEGWSRWVIAQGHIVISHAAIVGSIFIITPHLLSILLMILSSLQLSLHSLPLITTNPTHPTDRRQSVNRPRWHPDCIAP